MGGSNFRRRRAKGFDALKLCLDEMMQAESSRRRLTLFCPDGLDPWLNANGFEYGVDTSGAFRLYETTLPEDWLWKPLVNGVYDPSGRRRLDTSWDENTCHLNCKPLTRFSIAVYVPASRRFVVATVLCQQRGIYSQEEQVAKPDAIMIQGIGHVVKGAKDTVKQHCLAWLAEHGITELDDPLLYWGQDFDFIQ